MPGPLFTLGWWTAEELLAHASGMVEKRATLELSALVLDCGVACEEVFASRDPAGSHLLAVTPMGALSFLSTR